MSNFTSNYKSRLKSLKLLPLMMLFELGDIVFFIKSLLNISDSLNILSYGSFTTGTTRSVKFINSSKSSVSGHFYFRRLPRLWNALPPINLNLSINVIHKQVKKFFWSHFLLHFDSDNICWYHFLCPRYNCSKNPVLSNYAPFLS